MLRKSNSHFKAWQLSKRLPYNIRTNIANKKPCFIDILKHDNLRLKFCFVKCEGLEMQYTVDKLTQLYAQWNFIAHFSDFSCEIEFRVTNQTTKLELWDFDIVWKTKRTNVQQ